MAFHPLKSPKFPLKSLADLWKTGGMKIGLGENPALSQVKPENLFETGPAPSLKI